MSWDQARAVGALTKVQQALRRTNPTTLAHLERTRDPFRLLVACIISLRTKDAVTAQASQRLLAEAPTAQELARLAEDRIAQLIYPAGFYRTKARQLKRLAQELLEQYQGHVPRERAALLALPGVGRKTANLVLGLGFGVPAICVDTHVHRIANRLGLVRTRHPAETEQALEHLLPQKWWIPLNDLLVRFGQQVCTPRWPRCSSCTLGQECPRVGVSKAR
ncbi:MAG: endonuclease III [Thermoanaerobaculum sp.]|nr:endonuclease III [Thermoanaerobaculum sp.]MDW7967583.1 endonuclease III [Thermoanaerobaculum sp.]